MHAQSLDLSGKSVTLAIATPSGGGYDLYGRMVARHIGRYLPGNPTVVPQNMPGAGSLIAANWLANVAPKDGTAIAIIPSATLFENLLGNAQRALRRARVALAREPQRLHRGRRGVARDAVDDRG